MPADWGAGEPSSQTTPAIAARYLLMLSSSSEVTLDAFWMA